MCRAACLPLSRPRAPSGGAARSEAAAALRRGRRRPALTIKVTDDTWPCLLDTNRAPSMRGPPWTCARRRRGVGRQQCGTAAPALHGTHGMHGAAQRQRRAAGWAHARSPCARGMRRRKRQACKWRRWREERGVSTRNVLRIAPAPPLTVKCSSPTYSVKHSVAAGWTVSLRPLAVRSAAASAHSSSNPSEAPRRCAIAIADQARHSSRSNWVQTLRVATWYWHGPLN